MGFWGLGIVVAPMLGPVLGGWLTDNYLALIFLVMLPLLLLMRRPSHRGGGVPMH